MGFLSDLFSGRGIIHSETVYIPLSDIELSEEEKERRRNSNCPLTQLVQALDDAKDEFHEIMTDGAKEILIHKNNDYKTSFENKETADNIISKANWQFSQAQTQVKKDIEALNKHIFNNYSRKKELLIQIDEYLPNQDKILFNKSQISCQELNWCDIVDKNSSWFKSDQRARKDASEEYLENAKDHAVILGEKTAELENVRTKISVLDRMLKEEESFLTILEQIQNPKQEFNMEKANILRGLLSEYIVDNYGNPNSKYKNFVEQLKRICSRF